MSLSLGEPAKGDGRHDIAQVLPQKTMQPSGRKRTQPLGRKRTQPSGCERTQLLSCERTQPLGCEENAAAWLRGTKVQPLGCEGQQSNRLAAKRIARRTPAQLCGGEGQLCQLWSTALRSKRLQSKLLRRLPWPSDPTRHKRLWETLGL